MAVFDEATDPSKTTSTTDTATLEKRLTDKDAFIEQLKQENATAREAVAAEERKRKALEEVLLKQQVTPPANQDTRTQPVVEAPSDEDLAERIKRVTQEERENDRVKSNLDLVAEKLIETYGSEEKAKEIVSAKAKELGVSPKFLQQVAAASPNAFFKQIDLTPSATKPIVPNPSRGTVNTAAMGGNKQQNEPAPNTYKYFQKIKEEKGMSYFLNPAVQNAMHKAVMDMGEEAFYA